MSILMPNKMFIKDSNSSVNIVSFDNRDFNTIKENILDDKIAISSTFYQIQNNQDINVAFSYSSINKEIVHDISVEALRENYGYDIEDNIFPSENLIVSDIKIFRGVLIKQISFVPFSYNVQTQELSLYNDVEIHIENIEIENSYNFTPMLRSKSFEPLLEDLIINYERSSREEDYQTPSILYVCGGSSINHPFVEELVEWRHKRGYIVNTVSTNEIGSSNSSVKNYIENAYNTWENPPEIVGLIGDTGGSYAIGYYTESWSGYGGAGDFPYCQLDGNDLLPEVFIGRISVNSSGDLSNVLNKTLAYEKATYINQTGTSWYERAALCGDPSSSGWSTVITNEYVENILDVNGFEDINTNYGNGNYDNWLEDQLEDGSLYMNYRGYYGASGFGSSEINGANNGYMTPFASFITCGTGDFNGTSLSEDLFRAGTVSNPKGAVAAIGTSTTGTHTFFNNIMSMGIYDGIFPKEIISAGGATASGRLSLFHTYPTDPSNRVSVFSHWLNLMGDPALLLWTDTPEEILVDFNNSVTWGTNFIDVHVSNSNGVSVEDALVTLLKGDDEIFVSKLTDIHGNARIMLDYESTGEVFLTVTKKNCIPIEESFQIVNSDNNVNLDVDNIIISDEADGVVNGNNDGLLNPGEIVYLSLPLTNYGMYAADNVQAILTSESDHVNIIYGISQYDVIAPGMSGMQNTNFVVELTDNALDRENLELVLTISNPFGLTWESVVPLDVHGVMLVADHIQYLDNFELNPGEIGDLVLHVHNQGSIALEDATIELLPSGSLIDILQPYSSFGTINSNDNGQTSSSNPLSVFINGNTINGSSLSLNTLITSANGTNYNAVFSLQIGHVTVVDPLGPDEHGYYIYDSGDLGYSLAPVYDWIEIDNDLGGDGINLNLSDSGDGNNISNNSAFVNLPFDFTFYGETYDMITVNTNGWISFGQSNLESFRNYPIPGAGGPSPMLAAFWDDLKTTGGGEVYKYIGDNFVIIEWSDMKTYNNNSNETFQVILYDDSSLTPTGDNEILIQYKDFNNTSNGSYGGWSLIHGCYSTIGIENQYSTIGLEYTFDNIYPTAAMPLSDQKAIFITTRNPVETLMGDSNQDGEVNVIDVVIIVNHILVLELLSSMEAFMSDMDGDGNITILDVIQVIQVILES